MDYLWRMFKYILRRLMLALPTLLIISMIAFLMGQQATHDPVAQLSGAPYQGTSKNPDAEAAYYLQQAVVYHLDKPAFYFNITADCFPDTLYKVFPPWRKDKMTAMAVQCGQWEPVAQYEKWLADRIEETEALPDSTINRTALNKIIASLKTETAIAGCDTLLAQLADQVKNTLMQTRINERAALFPALQAKDGWGMPAFYWYGFNNQYNDWLTGRFAKEQFSPWKKIIYPLRVTLFINIAAILLSLMLGVFTGVMISGRKRKVDLIGKRVLVIIYVIPVLVIGPLLRYLFATKGIALYAPWIGGVGTSNYDPEAQQFWWWAFQNKGRLFLPVLTLTIHLWALLALQMRTGMMGVLQLDFIRTARAKGMSEHQVRWGHAFKNALFPIITILGGLIPFAVGGSVIVEAVFNINGLGHSILEAFLSNDHSVLMSVVMLSALLTITGNLVSDILFAWIDPRVKLEK